MGGFPFVVLLPFYGILPGRFSRKYQKIFFKKVLTFAAGYDIIRV
jgi:hypothetical protein